MNGNGEFIEPRYVTEKTINVGKPSSDGRQYRSMIEVNGNSFSGNKPRSYDQLDGYQSRVDSILNHQQNYHETPEPERKHYTDVDRDTNIYSFLGDVSWFNKFAVSIHRNWSVPVPVDIYRTNIAIIV
jgi:hypothetical protein